jgi:hypothetical protein
MAKQFRVILNEDDMRIYAGKVEQDSGDWHGKSQDVTDDTLLASLAFCMSQKNQTLAIAGPENTPLFKLIAVDVRPPEEPEYQNDPPNEETGAL